MSIYDDKTKQKKAKNKKIGIYLADLDNNVTLLHEEEGFAFLEPIPLIKQKVPPVLPGRINLEETEAIVNVAGGAIVLVEIDSGRGGAGQTQDLSPFNGCRFRSRRGLVW